MDEEREEAVVRLLLAARQVVACIDHYGGIPTGDLAELRKAMDDLPPLPMENGGQ